MRKSLVIYQVNDGRNQYGKGYGKDEHVSQLRADDLRLRDNSEQHECKFTALRKYRSEAGRAACTSYAEKFCERKQNDCLA